MRFGRGLTCGKCGNKLWFVAADTEEDDRLVIICSACYDAWSVKVAYAQLAKVCGRRGE